MKVNDKMIKKIFICADGDTARHNNNLVLVPCPYY